jgi:hypothetical protein
MRQTKYLSNLSSTHNRFWFFILIDFRSIISKNKNWHQIRIVYLRLILIKSHYKIWRINNQWMNNQKYREIDPRFQFIILDYLWRYFHSMHWAVFWLAWTDRKFSPIWTAQNSLFFKKGNNERPCKYVEVKLIVSESAIMYQ